MDSRFPWIEFPHDRQVFTGCTVEHSKEVRRIGAHVCNAVGNSLGWTWNPRARSVNFHYGDDITVSAGTFPLFADGVGDRAMPHELDTLVGMIRRANRPKDEKVREEQAAAVSAENDRNAARERRVSDAMPHIKDGLAFKDRARRGVQKLILPGGDS